MDQTQFQIDVSDLGLVRQEFRDYSHATISIVGMESHGIEEPKYMLPGASSSTVKLLELQSNIPHWIRFSRNFSSIRRLHPEKWMTQSFPPSLSLAKLLLTWSRRQYTLRSCYLVPYQQRKGYPRLQVQPPAQVISHQLGGWRSGFGLVCLEIRQIVEGLLPHMLHSNKRRQEMFQNFIQGRRLWMGSGSSTS